MLPAGDGAKSVVFVLIFALLACGASAQERSPSRWPGVTSPGARYGLATGEGNGPRAGLEAIPFFGNLTLSGPDAWGPVAASALLPGVGQLLQGRRRGWLYLGLEALVWVGYLSERDRGRGDRQAYRDLAWEVARSGSGNRVDGDFEYYERLAYWARSGAFDADLVTPGLQPEEDTATFNGDAWRLAVSIFLGGGPADPGSPGYEAALEYYRGRAYPDGFLWDWTGKPEGLARYRGLIDSSDDHLRKASLILGGAVVNRVASSLDAVLTRRLGREAAVRLVPGPGSGGVFYQSLTLRVVLK
ncbi:MAG: hypothetical protein JSU98_14265 [Gemmatimonadales bacterium]|nr:MAG: hypothetical protein JSU98_14265 [Gemmatimonadales bacterium]